MFIKCILNNCKDLLKKTVLSISTVFEPTFNLKVNAVAINFLKFFTCHQTKHLFTTEIACERFMVLCAWKMFIHQIKPIIPICLETFCTTIPNIFLSLLIILVSNLLIYDNNIILFSGWSCWLKEPWRNMLCQYIHPGEKLYFFLSLKVAYLNYNAGRIHLLWKLKKLWTHLGTKSDKGATQNKAKYSCW